MKEACSHCNKELDEITAVRHSCGALCEDCYIDLQLPPVGKMMYDRMPGSFMLRLKDSFIACPQRYH